MYVIDNVANLPLLGDSRGFPGTGVTDSFQQEPRFRLVVSAATSPIDRFSPQSLRSRSSLFLAAGI